MDVEQTNYGTEIDSTKTSQTLDRQMEILKRKAEDKGAGTPGRGGALRKKAAVGARTLHIVMNGVGTRYKPFSHFR